MELLEPPSEVWGTASEEVILVYFLQKSPVVIHKHFTCHFDNQLQ